MSACICFRAFVRHYFELGQSVPKVSTGLANGSARSIVQDPRRNHSGHIDSLPNAYSFTSTLDMQLSDFSVTTQSTIVLDDHSTKSVVVSIKRLGNTLGTPFQLRRYRSVATHCGCIKGCTAATPWV